MVPGLGSFPGLGVAPGILTLITSDCSAVILEGLSRLYIEGLIVKALIVNVTVEELVLERIFLLDRWLGSARIRVRIPA